MHVLLTAADFDVPDCVTQHYRKDDGFWWWHCMTCDTATQRRKHGRGHKRERDAAHAAAAHARDRRRRRQQQAWRADWKHKISTTDDPVFFGALWDQVYEGIRWTVPVREAMARVRQTLAG